MAEQVIKPQLIGFLLASALTFAFMGLFFVPLFFLAVFSGGIIAGGFLFLLLLITLLPVIWNKLRWDNYFVILEKDAITIKSGVISKSVASFSYKEIEQVDQQEDFVSRILGVSNLNIYTMSASSAVAGTIIGLSKRDAEFIQSKVLSAKHGKVSVQKSSHKVSVLKIERKGPVLASAKLSLPAYDKMVWRVFGSVAALLWLFTFVLLITVQFISGEQLPFVVILGSIAFAFSFIPLLAIQQAHTMKFQIQRRQAFLFYEVIFNKFQASMPYAAIQDVTVTQSFYEKWFGLCTLVVQTGKRGHSSESQVFTMVPALSLQEAERLKKVILQKVR